ncbi:hypothetical protein HMPREF3039_03277 [Akkermansia sp. KLE1798]|nr:hypothetical protein HMPREF3039_03277 [Akkermansia sp. KLE1798]
MKLPDLDPCIMVSIHAPRVRCDSDGDIYIQQGKWFQSTHLV